MQCSKIDNFKVCLGRSKTRFRPICRMFRNNSSLSHRSLKKIAGLIRSSMTCNKEIRT